MTKHLDKTADWRIRMIVGWALIGCFAGAALFVLFGGG